MVEPSSLPLSGGILAGLMWVPLSWIIQHWVGLFHAITRTVLVAGAWFLFPDHRFIVIPVLIVIVYLSYPAFARVGVRMWRLITGGSGRSVARPRS